MLVETFLRKQLGLKAHTVKKVEETEKFMPAFKSFLKIPLDGLTQKTPTEAGTVALEVPGTRAGERGGLVRGNSRTIGEFRYRRDSG